MNKSDNINELASALSLFQGEVEDATKDKTGHGYNYADLSKVLSLVRPLLKKHGLSVSQLCSGTSENMCIDTLLMHTSGQWIAGSLPVPVDSNNKRMNALQAIGSVITYARRYSLAAILGVAQTDDDGHSAETVVRPVTGLLRQVTSKLKEREATQADVKNMCKALGIANYISIKNLNEAELAILLGALS